MARGDAPSTEEMARVYGAAPDAFTKERDALARELKGAGRAAASTAVKALKKPTRSAWAVDQLARRFPDRIDALLRAGEELAAAQRRALKGEGGDVLRAAAARERELVNGLTDAAASILAAHGNVPGDLVSRVRSTLHALPTAAEEDRQRVRDGTLDGDLTPDPFGLLADAGPATKSTVKRPTTRDHAADRRLDARQATDAREAARAEKAREAADAREAARRERARAKAVEAAEREVDRRQDESRRAEKELAASEKAEAKATAATRSARELATKTAAALEEARRKLDAARS